MARVIIGLIVAIVAVVTGYAETVGQLQGKDLVAELQKGGYVLFIRHPQTNPDQADTDPLNLDNTKAQRQLSEDGRSEAKAIGLALSALKIPVDRVISSRFHRANEASTLLGVGEVTTTIDVSEGGLVVSPRENQRRAKALRLLLSTAPAAGKNTIIVSHRPNVQDAAGKEFGDVTEGEIVVFKPLGESKFECVARVAPPARWTDWAQ